MKTAYCQRCGKETTFKRSFGIKTYLSLLLTFGVWAIAMPLYPARCIECGSKAQRVMDRKEYEAPEEEE